MKQGEENKGERNKERGKRGRTLDLRKGLNRNKKRQVGTFFPLSLTTSLIQVPGPGDLTTNTLIPGYH